MVSEIQAIVILHDGQPIAMIIDDDLFAMGFGVDVLKAMQIERYLRTEPEKKAA